MVVTALVFGKWLQGILNGSHTTVWTSDTIKGMLTTSTYSPDQDAHDYRDDVTNEVANGSGYATGGVTLGSKTATYTGATNKLALSSAALSWTGASFTFRRLVLYKAAGGASSADPIICVQSNDADISPGGADLTLTPHADGWVSLVVA